ncbi:unnamed protein product [Leptidea sinapis]|uniref:Uncharacterized protein n=1 Tax=Leptidea sinapis TaxID=189913 RepID=A0A5E4QUN8_9NEOP|nr:unnamed protein product [Leptidea sinapis]
MSDAFALESNASPRRGSIVNAIPLSGVDISYNELSRRLSIKADSGHPRFHRYRTCEGGLAFRRLAKGGFGERGSVGRRPLAAPVVFMDCVR